MAPLWVDFNYPLLARKCTYSKWPAVRCSSAVSPSTQEIPCRGDRSVPCWDQLRSTFYLSWNRNFCVRRGFFWGGKQKKNNPRKSSLPAASPSRCTSSVNEINKSDGASDKCLSEREKHTLQTAESGGFRVFRLCHFSDDVGALFPPAASPSFHWRTSGIFPQLLPAASPVPSTRRALGKLCSRASFYAFPCMKYFPSVYMRVIIITCICTCVFSSFIFLLLQVYVPWRYAPGNSGDCALGFWALSVFVAEGGEVPCCVLLSCAVLCPAVCVWRHVPGW